MKGVSHEGDFKESVGTFLMPESVRRRDSAMSLSGVEVDSIDKSLVSLGVTRNLRSKLVEWLGKPRSNVERNRIVKER